MATLHNEELGANEGRIINSLLDTDLYKLTMQQAVLHHFSDKQVAYRFTNRSIAMKFTRSSVASIQAAINALSALQLTFEELAWLRSECPYLKPNYLEYLSDFQLRPKEQVKVTFVPSQDGDAGQELGDLEIDIEGNWKEVILYEVPLMAIVSEVYFREVEKEWTLTGQRALAEEKAVTLIEAGIRFSEFGTRRRRSYATHKAVVEGLLRGEAAALQRSASASGHGKMLGSSNVHFCQMFNLTPVGTVAHEWMMAVAALQGYTHANLNALRLWDQVYSSPAFEPMSPAHDLTIALTDTFSTRVFFDDLLSGEEGKEIARRWRGLRQDSGDPKVFVRKAKEVYDKIGVDSKQKVVIFSDGLNVARCLELAKVSKEVGIAAGFGVGTFLTNDFRRTSASDASPDLDASPSSSGDVSKALNIVIKLRSIEGRPAVKISDDLTKNTGDKDEVAAVKRRFGLDKVEAATEDA